MFVPFAVNLKITTKKALGEWVLRERAITVGCQLPGKGSAPIEMSMGELAQLVRTAGGIVVNEIVQKRQTPDSRLYIGKGLASVLKETCNKESIGLVVFNHELSPSQTRNLNDFLGVKVIDRTQLILDIFAKHAASYEGRIQVEIAQLRYLLPRLTGQGLALSRLAGGIGTRGPGEAKLETDRRSIKGQIDQLETQLKSINNSRLTQRKKRSKTPIPLVALAGYTNAGKSTLHHQLTQSNAYVADALFATLDPLTRFAKLPSKRPFLVTDTVGFITDLPTTLVRAFHSTLDIVVEADCVLHMIDVASPYRAVQAHVGQSTLAQLGVCSDKIITVFNKLDLVDDDVDWPMLRSFAGEHHVLISAKTGTGMPSLWSVLEDFLSQNMYTKIIFLPYHKGHYIDYLYKHSKILSKCYSSQGLKIICDISYKDLERLKRIEEIRIL